MVEKNTPRYIDILPQLVDSYNRTWHSGIHSEPINVNKKIKNNSGGKCTDQRNLMILIKKISLLVLK